jgi:hypothetical protein
VELLLLVPVTALCWFVAFSKSARRKLPTPWWIKSVGKSEDEQRLMTDILLRVMGAGGRGNLWLVDDHGADSHISLNAMCSSQQRLVATIAALS